MSRQVIFHQTGGPEVLHIEEAEVRPARSGEVRIRVRAIGLNRAEAMFRSGEYIINPIFPASLGYEASGVIESVGDDVRNLSVGDPVSVIPAFTMHEYTMYGELIVAPAFAVVKHPETLSFEEAAASWMQYATAYGALVELAHITFGDIVVIPAASSSVGIAAIQIARMVGARAIALTRSMQKAQALLQLGASHVIATDTGDVVREIDRITLGRGARIVFDPVGGSLFGQLLHGIALNGIAILYGALSSEATQISPLDMIGKHIAIHGYEVLEMTRDLVRIDEMKHFVLSGLADGKLRPVIARTFSLEAVAEAHRFMEAGQHTGKIVLTV